jgi:hypothetical protein
MTRIASHKPFAVTASKFRRSARAVSGAMKNWISQIVIGVIVTVVGTVIANAVIGHGRHAFPGVHLSRSAHGR